MKINGDVEIRNEGDYNRYKNVKSEAEKKMRAVVEIGREILDYIPLPDEIEARLDACIEEAELLMKEGER